DIDECATGNHTCDQQTKKCFNILGSYECNCKEGYIPTSEGLPCNETCMITGCQDHATCRDVGGSEKYKCSCNPGYIQSDTTCLPDPPILSFKSLSENPLKIEWKAGKDKRYFKKLLTNHTVSQLACGSDSLSASANSYMAVPDSSLGHGTVTVPFLPYSLVEICAYAEYQRDNKTYNGPTECTNATTDIT
ncbi:unnamed protein product, partial [Meganyctiphanes norvegica]